MEHQNEYHYVQFESVLRQLDCSGGLLTLLFRFIKRLFIKEKFTPKPLTELTWIITDFDYALQGNIIDQK